jgi:MFS family permease
MDEVTFRVSLLEYKRLFTTKPLLHRLMLGAAAQGLQQWTGINAIIYYAPRIFEQIGLTGSTIPILATGIVGVVNFVFTIPAVLFVDNFGRKPMLALGEANMAVSHATIAAILAVYGNSFDTHKSAGNGAVFMVYWYIAWFAVTWGPLAWVVSAEVFPLDMRAKGMSISSAVNWIMSESPASIASSKPELIAQTSPSLRSPPS